MRGAITPHVAELEPRCSRACARAPKMDGLDLVPRVTCATRYEWTEPTWRAARRSAARRAAAADRVPRRRVRLRDQGEHPAPAARHRLPRHGRAGDDAARATRSRSAPTGSSCRTARAIRRRSATASPRSRELCASGKPVFGICLGHQILGLALGGKTFKLPFGHHGGNHPVLDKTTGKVEITSQNHGFAVDPTSAAVGRARHAREPVRSLERGHRGRRQADLQRAVPPRGEPGPARRRATCSRGFATHLAAGAMTPIERALLDEVIEELYARHTADADGGAGSRGASTRSVAARSTRTTSCGSRGARRSSSGSCRARRGRASAAAGGRDVSRARRGGRPTRADACARCVTSQRSLFEVRAMARGRIELLDLLGGAEFARRRAAHAARRRGRRRRRAAAGRRAAARSGSAARSSITRKPRAAAIVERARAMLAKGATPARRDRSDRAAARPGHALSPHAAGAGLRARLADHGMTTRSRRGSWRPLCGSRPLRARTRRSTGPRRSMSIATITPPGAVEFGFDGGAPVEDVGARRCGSGTSTRPITLQHDDAETHPVDHRETLVARRRARDRHALVVDARMPLAHQIGDRAHGPRRRSRRSIAGCPAISRVGARLRVASARSFGAFLRAELTLPTGDDYDFAGDAELDRRVEPDRRGSSSAPASCSRRPAGIRLRGAEVMLADRADRRRAFGAVGVVVPVPPIAHLWCKAEQLAATAEVVGVLGDEVDQQARAVAGRGAARRRDHAVAARWRDRRARRAQGSTIRSARRRFARRSSSPGNRRHRPQLHPR